MNNSEISYDIIVIGSGGNGLTAALRAANEGAEVAVFERSPLFGGTTAISGGGIWIPDNHHMKEQGFDDSPEEARSYLDQLTLGCVTEERLNTFIIEGPNLVKFIERMTPLLFSAVDRPDYHPSWKGAKRARALELSPVKVDIPEELRLKLRYSITRAPVTYPEARNGIDPAEIERRREEGIKTQGTALIEGLVKGCYDKGVKFINNFRVQDLLFEDSSVKGVKGKSNTGDMTYYANKAVIIASGGFEWNDKLKKTFLPCRSSVNVTPPWNEGDGLKMGMKVGAALDNMTASWWTPAIKVPEETYDGKPMARNIVRDLAMPGSILVNTLGKRFTNEASGYVDMGKSFLWFDPVSYEYPNEKAYLLFDHSFKNKNAVATIPTHKKAPDWFWVRQSLDELAESIGVSSTNLRNTIETFNQYAREGYDPDFKRGDNAHDRYNGDSTHTPNPCLGPIEKAPFYAVPIYLGIVGTSGGLKTDHYGRVLGLNGEPISDLYACGDVAATAMGIGYPGAGGTLGPGMTFAYIAGYHAVHND